MIVVLDASAAVGVTLMQPQAKPFISHLETANLVLTPDLFVSEVCNAFWKYRKANLLDREQAEQLLAMTLELQTDLSLQADS